MQEIVFLEPNKSIWIQIAKALGIALEIFSVLVISILIGVIIDRYLLIKPFGIIIGSLFGIVSSFKKIISIGEK